MTESSRPSFLEAVLANAGEVEISDLKECIVDVTKNISQLKRRVHDYMRSNYVDFDPLFKKPFGYLDKAIRTKDEVNTLFQRIEFQTKHDLANSTGELRNLHASLKEASTVLSISTELLQMESAMKEVSDFTNNGQFLDAAKSLQTFRELLKGSAKETQQLDIYKALSRESCILSTKFYNINNDKLNSFVSWESEDLSNNVTKSTLKIKSDHYTELTEVTQALHLLEELDPWMKKFRSFLMRSILSPIIINEAVVTVEENELFCVIQVAVKTSSRNHNYNTTLKNLTKFFEFLHQNFNIELESGDSFISILSSGISEDFTNNLIKNCLKETVSDSSDGRVQFEGIREHVANFHAYMVAIDFLPEENRSLLDYVENFDALCASKVCENYLKKAREIMKWDLQDMVQVGPQTPTVSLISTLENYEALIDNAAVTQESYASLPIQPENELNPSLFQFPTCFVSKSTIKILELVRTILEQLGSKDSEKNDLSHYQFYVSTARSVFELFIAVMPTIHEKLLNSIPQQVALFHNSCMYLAHQLIVLGFEVETSVRTVVKADTPVIFVDLVQSLRHLGTSKFVQHMQMQRKQILDIVKESGLATLGENSELSPDTEKSLRQCLRQLELLQTVWQKVLPQDVYCKSLGALANAFLEELVIRILSVEDIPANTAVQLTTFFKMVQSRIPQLFEDGCEVVLYVKKWLKFKELLTVLGANLKEIEERWSDGKGPLAHEFTAEQVKQLVRALFQNTQRRAEVLVKIK